MLSEFNRVRAQSQALILPLSAEDCCAQSMPDASPAKWHLAHTTWFFETFFLEKRPSYRPFNPRYRALFNSYYQSVGPQHLRSERGLITRPSLAEVLEYRAVIDDQIRALLQTSLSPADAAILQLGLAHEEQHQELLLTDIKHLLSKNPVFSRYGAPELRSQSSQLLEPSVALNQAPNGTWSHFSGGLGELGSRAEAPTAPSTEQGFAFDNETPRHRVYAQPYGLATHLVTCGQWRAFLDDAGYLRPELWLSEGWQTACANQWTLPEYWYLPNGDKRETPWLYTLAGPRPVHDAEPVCHISYYEADAFARWSGKRLPTEAEWELAAVSQPVAGNLLESGQLHPTAARSPASATGEPESALAQLFGDVWEWTQSAYAPYPGYRPLAGALGEYNGKFMCNQFVLRGGSCATPIRHIRPTYRNFFPAEARWQFTGLRLAEDHSADDPVAR